MNDIAPHAAPGSELAQFVCGHYISKHQLEAHPYCFACGESVTELKDFESPFVKLSDIVEKVSKEFFEGAPIDDAAALPDNTVRLSDIITKVSADFVNPEPADDHGLSKLTRKQCLAYLSDAGYTGPTSYTMTRLRAIVADHMN